jgi:hypothetical protein
MTFALTVAPLVILLYAVIFSITQVKHSPPQAYYLKKKRGATIAMAEKRTEPAVRERGLWE